MSNLRLFYYNVLNFLINLITKSKVIPDNPVKTLGLGRSTHYIYALPYQSIADLLAIRTQCLKLGLPDPLNPVKVDHHSLPRFVFIDEGPRLFKRYHTKPNSVAIFHQYLDLHKNNSQLDIRIVPISVLFGRSPGKENQHAQPSLRLLNGLQKFFTLLWLGRDAIIRFSDTVSLRYMADVYGTDTIIAKKLARVAYIHFSRQRLAAVGPRLPDRQLLFSHLLASEVIEQAIQDEARVKKISVNKVRQNAVDMLEEIAANFSYQTVRLVDRVLSWTWNRLYQGINVSHVESVRKLAQEGHELVYIPCHRSHMDYLLLSYVLYHQGLVPPHIAAGVNLNFWPAGPLARRLGAFFIRRSFKGSSKLYPTIFREYLGELCNRGYSIEYFIEGGRSRTGRLLEPKTGTLAMTIQAVLRGGNRPITLIPVYIGYEHVIEVATYAKELRGATKEKESLLQVLRTVRKLRNFGQCYVNFGQPIPLRPYLNQHAPQWKESIDPLSSNKPTWLTSLTNKLAEQIMVNINQAAAINAINLCATVLLASRQRALSHEQLIEQIQCYLQLLQQAPYSAYITLPPQTANNLLEHALSLKKFVIDQDSIGELISLTREQAILMTYYRNNIQHLFVLPALVATIMLHHPQNTIECIINKIKVLYPMLRKELFLSLTEDKLSKFIHQILEEFVRQQLLFCQHKTLSLNSQRLRILQLLAACIEETLQRYAITFSLLSQNPYISKNELEKESQNVAHRLSVLHGINTPEFFDKAVFASLISTLKEQGYLNDSDTPITEETRHAYQLISSLLSTNIRLTIEGAVLTPAGNE